MPAETGFPRADVSDDFLRARRRQVLARLAQWLRGEPDDVNLILPFDDVIAALGRKGERSLGLQTIALDTVVGTVDSRRDFDRHFRPTSSRVRERWERLALASKRGESIPPIDVYRVGDGDDPPHRGFECLHGLAARLRPPLLLHGHVHPFGEDAPDRFLGDTVVRNVVGRHRFDLSGTEVARSR